MFSKLGLDDFWVVAGLIGGVHDLDGLAVGGNVLVLPGNNPGVVLLKGAILDGADVVGQLVGVVEVQHVHLGVALQDISLLIGESHGQKAGKNNLRNGLHLIEIPRNDFELSPLTTNFMVRKGMCVLIDCETNLTTCCQKLRFYSYLLAFYRPE